MASHPFTLALAATAAVMAAAPAAAQLTFIGRSVAVTIKTTKPDFSDAVMTLDTTTVAAPGASAANPLSRQESSRPLAGFSGGTLTTTGGVMFSDYKSSADQLSVLFTATGSGSFTFHNTYASGVDDAYADATLFRYTSAANALPPFVNRGLPVVEFYLGGGIGAGGQVDAGYPFTFSLTIPGDYSGSADLASGKGQHYEDPDVTALDGFTRQRNYAYDPVADTTTVSFYDEAIQPASDALYLDSYFFGGPAAAALPEPAAWAAMTVGLGAIGAVLRRRGRAPAAARVPTPA